MPNSRLLHNLQSNCEFLAKTSPEFVRYHEQVRSVAHIFFYLPHLSSNTEWQITTEDRIRPDVSSVGAALLDRLSPFN